MTKTNWDTFFYYGDDPANDAKYDLLNGVLQPERSLFFNRQDGAGIKSKENYPNSISLFIGVQYGIAKWVAYRNSYVSEENPDMRIAISQESIIMKSDRKGNSELDLRYILFSDYENIADVKIPIFGGV